MGKEQTGASKPSVLPKTGVHIELLGRNSKGDLCKVSELCDGDGRVKKKRSLREEIPTGQSQI